MLRKTVRIDQTQDGRTKAQRGRRTVVEEEEILLVPVLFAFVKCGEHEGHYAGHIVTDQAQDVLVIPKIQGTLGHLWSGKGQTKNTTLSQPLHATCTAPPSTCTLFDLQNHDQPCATEFDLQNHDQPCATEFDLQNHDQPCATEFSLFNFCHAQIFYHFILKEGKGILVLIDLSWIFF
jgi:hypothetical protein